MTSQDTETPTPEPKAPNPLKLLTMLAGGAFALSLVTTALMVMQMMSHSAEDKIEQGATEIKETIAESNTILGKKFASLQTVCADWQAVLRSAGEKPDAVFKIVKTADGLLSLAEVTSGTVESTAQAQQESRK